MGTLGGYWRSVQKQQQGNYEKPSHACDFRNARVTQHPSSRQHRASNRVQAGDSSAGQSVLQVLHLPGAHHAWPQAQGTKYIQRTHTSRDRSSYTGGSCTACGSHQASVLRA